MKLQSTTSLEDFHSRYWYLADLVAFCRSHSLDTSGRKKELLARIEMFLRTGKKQTRPRSRSTPAPVTGPITLDTPVTAAFKCDSTTRAFLKSVVGEHFHFTAHLQQFRRAHPGPGPLTYRDLAREWVAERQRRKDRNYQSNIELTWQWNQFVRDFMADKPRNSGKSIRDAATAWSQIRKRPGPHTYEAYLATRRRAATR